MNKIKISFCIISEINMKQIYSFFLGFLVLGWPQKGLEARAQIESKTGAWIQEAIDALPVTGGVVELEEGIYRIEKPISLRSEVTLRGKGSKTRLAVQSECRIPILCNAHWSTGDSNIQIASLILDGNSAKQKPSDLTYQTRGAATHVNDVDGVGFYFANVKGLAINDLEFRNLPNEALFLVRCSSTRIEKNLFISCSQNSGKNDKAQGAMYLRYSSGTFIARNTIVDCYEGGIVLGLGSDRNTVLSNFVENSPSGEGVFIGAGCDNHVEGNRIVKTSHADGGTGAGIAISVPSKLEKKKNPAARNRILRNIIEHSGGSGIAVYRADNTFIMGNLIRSANENENSGSAGISLYEVEQGEVLGNRLVEVKGAGIAVARSSDVSIISNQWDPSTGALRLDKASTGISIQGNNE